MRSILMTFETVFFISKFQNVKAFKFNIQNGPRLMVKDTNYMI